MPDVLGEEQGAQCSLNEACKEESAKRCGQRSKGQSSTTITN